MKSPGALTVALGYLKRGWRPIPVHHRSKASTITGELSAWTVDAATAAQHFNGKPQNVGVVLGSVSRGLVDVDLDDDLALRMAPDFLPPTDAVFGRAGNPASHRLYQIEGETGKVKAFADESGTLVEYRADGGYTVFPGSTHESGEAIEWVHDGAPAATDRPSLLRAVGGLAAAAALAKRWSEGTQDNLSAAVIGALLRAGAPEPAVEKLIKAVCEAVGDNKIGKRLEKIGRFKHQLDNNPDSNVPGGPKLEQATDVKFVTRFKEWLGIEDAEAIVGPSDDDLALRFAEAHYADLRFVVKWIRWLEWDGKRWAEDDTLRVFNAARALCRQVRDELTPGLKPAQQKLLRQRLGAAATIYNVVKLAGNDRRMALTPTQLDTDAWALNTPTGIVDLRTGTVRPHNPAELHTKITAATPGGDCPIWDRTLARVVPDAEVRAYLQRLFGYGLTGSAREHVAPFFYGPGRNGKGTVAHAVRRALGDYGLEIGAEVLMESHNDRHPTELADLHGARLVVGSEVDTGRRWNEARLKRITGGDPISARRMGKDFFEFEPSHTLVLMGNSKPGLRSVDEAIRGRMHLVDFAVTIPEAERDTELPEKLAAEYGGILAWALHGCMEWQRDGLRAPDSVRAATDRYLQGEDHVAQWLDECCEFGGSITLRLAHTSYRLWCNDADVPFYGRNTFGDRLEAIDGVTRSDKREKTVTFYGIRIRKSSWEQRGEMDA